MTQLLLFSIPGLGILAAAVVVVYAIWRHFADYIRFELPQLRETARLARRVRLWMAERQ